MTRLPALLEDLLGQALAAAASAWARGEVEKATRLCRVAWGLSAADGKGDR